MTTEKDFLINLKQDEKRYSDSKKQNSTIKRPVYKIAEDILNSWDRPNFAARPYLAAMLTINSQDENFGYESAKSIILYFLSNASSFRGPEAKILKAELKNLIKN